MQLQRALLRISDTHLYIEPYDLLTDFRAIVQAYFGFHVNRGRGVIIRTRTEKPRKVNPLRNIRFIRYKLNSVEKKHYKGWAVEFKHEILPMLGQLVDSGNKVSLSFDGKNDTYICSVTCNDAKQAHADCCMVSRAGSPDDALLVALYKAHVIFAEVTWVDSATDDDWG